MNINEKHNSKLLVEGNDDQHVIWSLCRHHAIAETFDVIDCTSINNVLMRFALSVNEESSRVSKVGIVIDADTDTCNRWANVKEILIATGNYTVPENIPLGGLVLKSDQENKPTIGVWIMPDNKANGMLEDFMAKLTDEDDVLLAEVDEILLHIEEKKIHKYKAIHKAKARIHTYLAWQENPGTPMGLAITKKYLNPELNTCMPFVEWLKLLFIYKEDTI